MAKKFNFKNKSLWKKIGLGVLAGVVLIGAVFGVTALFRKSEETTKEISPTWAIGGLTEQGAYLETKESIYTKDAFGCQGLNIKIDFDNNISYRIFFYDYNDNFVGSTSKLTANYNEDFSLFVKSARIVITPNEDSKVSWYEKSGYAKQLTISVDKVQNDIVVNELEYTDLSVGYARGVTLPVSSSFAKLENYTTTGLISVGNYSKIEITAPAGGYICYIFYDAFGNNLMSSECGVNAVSSMVDIVDLIDIPTSATHVAFNVKHSVVPVEYYSCVFVK